MQSNWLSELTFKPDGHQSVPNQPLKNRAVTIIGGGPSLSRSVVNAVAPYPHIATNNAIYLLNAPTLLVAIDRRWYEWHGSAVMSMGHVPVTALRPGVNLPYRGPYYSMEKDREAVWPPNDRTLAGKNSGHAAITLAILLGATRIYLAGFDMGFVDGQSHWHPEHNVPSSEANYSSRFRPDLEKVAVMGQQRGVVIAAITPSQADIPHVPLEEAVKDLAR